MSPVGKRAKALLLTVAPMIQAATAEAETDSQLLWIADSLALLAKHARGMIDNEFDLNAEERELVHLLARLVGPAD